MITVGSTWRHNEGVVQTIDSVGDGWAEPHGCGQWKLPDFFAQWSHVSEPAPSLAPTLAQAHHDRGYALGRAAGAKAIADRVRHLVQNEGLIPLHSQRVAEIEAHLMALCAEVDP
jgi:hypothetical protein